MKQVVLITGHIASGKSSVSRGLSALAQELGLRATVVEMDDQVETLVGDWSRVTADLRRIAVELGASMVRRYLDSRFELVVVAGSTLAGYEREGIAKVITPFEKLTSVRLLVSLPESIRRAQGDPTRGATRDPAVVERHYARVDSASLPAVDLQIDTDQVDLSDVVQRVAGHVLAGKRSWT